MLAVAELAARFQRFDASRRVLSLPIPPDTTWHSTLCYPLHQRFPLCPSPRFPQRTTIPGDGECAATFQLCSRSSEHHATRKCTSVQSLTCGPKEGHSKEICSDPAAGATQYSAALPFTIDCVLCRRGLPSRYHTASLDRRPSTRDTTRPFLANNSWQQDKRSETPIITDEFLSLLLVLITNLYIDIIILSEPQLDTLKRTYSMATLVPPGIDVFTEPGRSLAPAMAVEEREIGPFSTREPSIAFEGDTASGAQFILFKMFPPELRLEIWAAALDIELENRLPVLLDTRIYPAKKLISPLLSVNTESRACALAVYDTKLAVYRVPFPVPDDLCYNEHFVEVDGVDMEYDGDWIDQDMFLDTTAYLIDNAENQGTCSGAVYVSAKKDRFVLPGMFDLNDVSVFSHVEGPYWTAAAAELRRVPRCPDQLSLKHVTAALPIPAVKAIETIILAQVSYANQDCGQFSDVVSFDQYVKDCEPYEYSLHDAKLNWDAKTFTGLKNWEHLWCFNNSLNEFLQMMFLTKDAGCLDIRRWSEIEHEPEYRSWGMESSDGRWMADSQARMKMWEEYQTRVSWS
ncbi:hypothetical protein F5Y18DRAFT_396506 [Xylariaceae sp. FL1019]|nr:hypothetical protein F5Y18DRAFT_396506 [Xylariaceae sp. FL1019]